MDSAPAADDSNARMITELVHGPSGARCRVHAFGATVLSYVPADGREVLFVSERAVLDGTKAIRGGIPLVFPIFGPPPPPSQEGQPASTMPQHGFARNNWWTKLPAGDGGAAPEFASSSSSSATYRLDLKDAANGRGANNEWEPRAAGRGGVDVRLELTVAVSAEALTTRLVVANTGADPFAFQALFHAYYRVSNHAALDPSATYIEGLRGYDALDQLTSRRSTVAVDRITIGSEVDSVHDPPPDSSPAASVTVGAGDPPEGGDGGEEGARVVEMRCEAQRDDGTSLPVSVVVWNPHAAKAGSLADFGDEEYHDMVCVEPGVLLGRPALGPGRSAALEQRISVAVRRRAGPSSAQET
jgi:glucose-6-phosphate 1-epimerase